MTKQDEARDAFEAVRMALVNASEALELAAEAAYEAYREAKREPEADAELADIVKWLRDFSVAVWVSLMATRVEADTALKLWKEYEAKTKRLAQLIEEER